MELACWTATVTRHGAGAGCVRETYVSSNTAPGSSASRNRVLTQPPTMSGRLKRALSADSQAAETQSKMKMMKGNNIYMQPRADTEEDIMMEVDSNYAAQEHRYDGSP